MKRPNILFLMTDQMQGRVLDPDHPCQTPNFDRLAARGVRLPRAYTPNAVCSPARASLMTGLLPHSHGVLEVTHTVDDDQCCLRTEFPHWAQRLEQAGYRTGYFGKWHIERSGDLTRFGWQVAGTKEAAGGAPKEEGRFSLQKRNDHPEGYRKTLLYGVTEVPPERRGVGITPTWDWPSSRMPLRETRPGAASSASPSPTTPSSPARRPSPGTTWKAFPCSPTSATI